MTVDMVSVCECGRRADYLWGVESVCRSCWEDLTSLEDEAIRRAVLGPWDALQKAISTGKVPGDDYYWIGPLPIPHTWSAWRDLLRRHPGER